MKASNPHIAGGSKMNADSLFRQAQSAARQGRMTEARGLLWAALQIQPNRAELWVWLAAVTPSPRAAMAYLANALTIDPRNPQARAGLRALRNRAAAAQALTAAPVMPPARKLKRQSKNWHWWVAGFGLTMLVFIFVAGMSFSSLAPVLAARGTVPAAAEMPDTTTWALPTREQQLPATWTPTPSPTTTPTPTPSPTATPTPTETSTPAFPSPTWVPTLLPTPSSLGVEGERWIDVNLTHQLLIAYEGTIPVRWVRVSTGLPNYPTVVGQFRIYVKYRSTLMTGDDYYLPNVPYTMYYYKGFGLHGTYWHNNFGYPMSHGCVNLPTAEAEWLFSFADVGTPVNIHY